MTRDQLISDLSRALRECFPDRAEAILLDLERRIPKWEPGHGVETTFDLSPLLFGLSNGAVEREFMRQLGTVLAESPMQTNTVDVRIRVYDARDLRDPNAVTPDGHVIQSLNSAIRRLTVETGDRPAGILVSRGAWDEFARLNEFRNPRVLFDNVTSILGYNIIVAQEAVSDGESFTARVEVTDDRLSRATYIRFRRGF